MISVIHPNTRHIPNDQASRMLHLQQQKSMSPTIQALNLRIRASICNVSPAIKQFPNFSLNTQSCCKAQGSWDEYRIAAWNLLWPHREQATQWNSLFTLKLLQVGFLESSLYLQNPGLTCNNSTALLKWNTDELSLTSMLQNFFRHVFKARVELDDAFLTRTGKIHEDSCTWELLETQQLWFQ